MLNALAQKAQLPAWFLNTPGGKKIQAAKQKADHATRQGLVDQLAVLQRERHAATERHDKEIAPLQKAWKTSQHKTRAAGEKLDAAVNRRGAANRQNDFAQRPLIRHLTASADPKIRAARDHMNRRWDEGHHQLARSGEEIIEGVFVNSGSAKKFFNNHASIVRLLEAIKATRLKFDQLAFANPEDLDEAITEILQPVERAWATSDEMREVGTNVVAA